jgi:hypothetical protein
LFSTWANAIFDSHYENSPAHIEFDPLTTNLAGLGIGLLATAAVSLSRSLADIPLAGAEVIRVAFRLGVLVDEVSIFYITLSVYPVQQTIASDAILSARPTIHPNRRACRIKIQTKSIAETNAP